MKLKIVDDFQVKPANIKVIGIGGAGGNAVNLMVSSNIKGINFITANTDAAALNRSLAEYKIQLGPKLTKGQGSGANPDIGRQATEESVDTIEQLLKGTDMLFITCGMGKGTGTGGSPIVAKISKAMEVLTVGVVTKPFMWEGKLRMAIAEEGIKELRKYTDVLIEIPNHKISSIIDENMLAAPSFEKSNEVLKKSVQSISDIITSQGIINVDFQDVKAIMKDAGVAMLGFGEASGESRVEQATKMAVSSPMLEDITISGAKGVLVNITGNSNDLKMEEVNTAMSMIYNEIAPDAKHIYGLVYDNELKNSLRITVIATGFPTDKKQIKSRGVRSGRVSEKELDITELKKPAFKRRKKSILK
ncbi:MAG: cell division protein FtsZ [Elusimicrobiota bacterium]